MSFKDMVKSDIHSIFLNCEEFADNRTVIYDGERYEKIPVILTGVEEKERENVRESDFTQGIYSAKRILYCASFDLDEVQPEEGTYIKVENEFGRFEEYRVVSSICEDGMLEIELEAFRE